MRDKGHASRGRIVEAATDLFYRRGYHTTSFADVAQASGIPKGNFYYYFKSKDDLLVAVIAERLEQIAGDLGRWNAEIPEPRARLVQFAETLQRNAEAISHWGCPAGSLNGELSKTQPDHRLRARRMLDVYREWSEGQIRALGRDDAHELAVHLLCMLQGASLLGGIYGDFTLITAETRQIRAWIDRL